MYCESKRDFGDHQRTSKCSVIQKQANLTVFEFHCHPLYSIYLCFYAAISLDQTARSLHNNSTDKLPLFDKSLTYYQNALSFVSSASFTTAPSIIRLTDRKINSPKRTSISSVSSSNRSSVDSIFSQSSSSSGVSEVSSGPPSPNRKEKYGQAAHRRNLSSTELQPAPLRIQKKVSFSPNLPTLATQVEAQTNDKDEDLTILDRFPLPPPSPPFLRYLPSGSQLEQDPQPNDVSHSNKKAAISRYQCHLTSFSAQLEYHIDAVHSQISAVIQSPRQPTARIIRPSLSAEEEVQRVELRTRIQRLKAIGWERKRFDGKRYQDLCEKAIAELNGGC